MLSSELFRKKRLIGIGQCIISFAAQTGAPDDRTERNQETQAVDIDGAKKIAQALDLGREGAPQYSLIQIAQQPGQVVAGAVYDRGYPTQACLRLTYRRLHGLLVSNVSGDVSCLHALRVQLLEM